MVESVDCEMTPELFEAVAVEEGKKDTIMQVD